MEIVKFIKFKIPNFEVKYSFIVLIFYNYKIFVNKINIEKIEIYVYFNKPII